MKILLLEDDLDLGETIEELLLLEDYEVDLVTNGEIAAQFIFEEKFDLYILDINVPKLNGIELFESLKNIKDTTPTIFISALVDIETITKVFELGAVDYIKKPFEPEELLLRIKKELNLIKDKNIIIFNNLEYNIQNKILKLNNSIISLGETQGKIFDLLIKNKGNVVQIEELYEEVNNFSNTALKSSINKLKHKLDIEIKNIRGIGYIVE